MALHIGDQQQLYERCISPIDDVKDYLNNYDRSIQKVIQCLQKLNK